MKICAVYIPQGFVIGEQIEEAIQESITIKNPTLVVVRPNGAALAPLLHMVDEDTITIKISDLAFGTVFTPKTELANEYRKLFGSGIIVSNVLPL
jgi:hypothetical protein